MMKKLYSIYYLFFLFTLMLTGLFMRVEEVNAFTSASDPVKDLVTFIADTTKNPDNLILEDNRKNKPKIFQDPVKTYDERQLLFFTTFGFDKYASNPVSVESLAVEPERIISNFKVYPNPLYVNTQNLKISYNIKKNALVTVKMLDVLGNEVSTLFVERVGAGYKTGEFNISSKVSGGFYFIRLSADSDHITKKISVVQ